MASNAFGTLFRITTWGESHGKAIGVVIDGCPAGLAIDEADINQALAWRRPGRNGLVSARQETDQAQIVAGLFEGKTTGAPLAILIPNQDADSSHYESLKDLLKPGHANYTYLKKYGLFDYRGGGRASARETACRVAAGAVAKAFIKTEGIEVLAYLKQIGKIEAVIEQNELAILRQLTQDSALFCPDKGATQAMSQLLEQTKNEGDSIGGIVEFMTSSMPIGLGEPLYQKLDATLAYALMGLPAAKGFEIGSGFKAATLLGSEHNDLFISQLNKIETETNRAGGILAGISTGMPLKGQVAFKPASSIMKSQSTVTIQGEPANFQLPLGSRHDPCVAIRAVPVVEAMVALVLADALLLNRCAKL